MFVDTKGETEEFKQMITFVPYNNSHEKIRQAIRRCMKKKTVQLTHWHCPTILQIYAETRATPRPSHSQGCAHGPVETIDIL